MKLGVGILLYLGDSLRIAKKLMLAFAVVLLQMPLLSFGQNTYLSVYYEPAITKLRLDDFQTGKFNGKYKYIYDFRRPTRPMYGYNLGLLLGRKFHRGLYSFESGFIYSIVRQHTGMLYGNYSNPPENYGGIDLIAECSQFEIPLNFEINKKITKKVRHGIMLGASYAILGQIKTDPLVLSATSGKKKGGSVVTWLYPLENFNDIKVRFKNDLPVYSRIGLSIGYKINYKLTKKVSIDIAPQFKYYTNSLGKTFFNADAFLLGTQFKLNFNK